MKIVNRVKLKLDNIGINKDYAEFSIDHLSAAKVSGWACRKGDSSNHTCKVSLLLGDKPITEGQANTYRDDLHDSGYGNGCFGFELPINWQALSVGENKISLYIDEYKVRVIKLNVTMPCVIDLAVKASTKK